jgi:hypothetical protein
MRVSTSPIRLPPTLLTWALLAFAGSHVSVLGEEITCLDGKVIKDVRNVSAKPDGITITTSDGMVGVPFTNLPQYLCRKYGYDPFAAGLYHASHPHRTTNHLTDAYSLDQLDLARAKALSTGKCLGFIVVWGTFFEVEVDPTTEGSSSALAQFQACFQDSLVLVYVRHENQLGNAPEAARRGLMGPDEGGWAPSMAVTDPTVTDYICEIPMGGPHSDGAIRMQVFRTGIERIKAYLAAHGGSSTPSAPATATATTENGSGTAPFAPASQPPAVAAAGASPPASPPADPAAAAAGGPPAATASTPAAPIPPAGDAAGTVASAPGGSSPREAVAAQPVEYQMVTLNDGRVLSGHLSRDQSKIDVINLRNGKAEGTLDIDPDAIVTVVKKSFIPGADAQPAASPLEHQLHLHERAVVMSILALNKARQLNADTIQEQLDWNRTPHKPTQDIELQAEFKAHVDNLYARLDRAKAAIPVARTALDQAMAAYRALGGTRVFTQLLIEPRPPK